MQNALLFYLGFGNDTGTRRAPAASSTCEGRNKRVLYPRGSRGDPRAPQILPAALTSDGIGRARHCLAAAFLPRPAPRPCENGEGLNPKSALLPRFWGHHRSRGTRGDPDSSYPAGKGSLGGAAAPAAEGGGDAGILGAGSRPGGIPNSSVPLLQLPFLCERGRDEIQSSSPEQRAIWGSCAPSPRHRDPKTSADLGSAAVLGS